MKFFQHFGMYRRHWTLSEVGYNIMEQAGSILRECCIYLFIYNLFSRCQ